MKLLFTKTKDRKSQIYCFNISSQTIDLNESYSLCAVDENTYRLHNVENFRSFRGFFSKLRSFVKCILNEFIKK